MYVAAGRAADILMARRTGDADEIAYTRLVRTVSVCMQGKCSEARAALKASQSPPGASAWVQTLFRHLTGDIDDVALLKGAATKEQETEAHMYVAMSLLAEQKTAEGIPHLKWVAERGSPAVAEYYVAVAHLTRIAKPSPAQ